MIRGGLGALGALVRSSSRGQLIPLVALCLTILLGATALVVDVGYWRYQQRLEQTAADSAALAGAAEIRFPNANDVTTAAINDATANGYTQGVANAGVVVNWPPQSGPNAGNASAVEVIVTKLQPSFFAGIFGIRQTVRARAVASLRAQSADCVYVTGDVTLKGGGGGGLSIGSSCGLVVNGNLTVTGQATVDAGFIAYAGTGPGGGSYPQGQPVHGVAGTDPCAILPGCAYLQTLKTTAPGLFSAACADAPAHQGTLPAQPLPPGHYCYGPYSSSVTLQPGLFVMDQGMFQGQTSGTGVTIYNNCVPTGGAKGNTCDVTLNGGAAGSSIVAPLTGASAGMVYYQPPALVNQVTLNGMAGTIQAIGGVYAPGASLTVNGQVPTLSLLVTGSIFMNGGGLNAGALGGFPVPENAVLAE